MGQMLITGATGFVGHHLVAALRARGHAVRVLALPSEDTRALERAHGVAVVRGDVRDTGAVLAAARGADAVVHMAAIHGLWRERSAYDEVNVRGTENVCRAVRAARVRRLVHVSSWVVYGMRSRRPYREDSPLAPVDDAYAITKAAADRLVQRLVAEEGLPAVIVRPSTMFGPGDRVNFGRMADRLRAGRVFIVGSGRNAVPFSYVTDVVEGIALAADHPAAAGRIYNLGTDAPLTQAELWSAVAEAIGAPPPRLRVPYAPLLAAAWGAEQAAALVGRGGQPLLTRLGVKLFGAENRLEVDRARRELGYAPRVPVREGVRLAAAWYRSAGAAPAVAA